jgi:predicted permease
MLYSTNRAFYNFFMRATELMIRWVPTLLAFPLGGAIAKIAFGGASSLGKSVGGGLIVGITVGLIQFLALKKYGITTSWITATAIATVVAAAINSYAFSFKFDSVSLTGSGLVAGLLVGIAQALSQTRDVKFALVWSICTAVAWTLAWFITSKVIVDPEAQYQIFGSSGALVATVGLGVVLKFALPWISSASNLVK